MSVKLLMSCLMLPPLHAYEYIQCHTNILVCICSAVPLPFAFRALASHFYVHIATLLQLHCDSTASSLQFYCNHCNTQGVHILRLSCNCLTHMHIATATHRAFYVRGHQAPRVLVQLPHLSTFTLQLCCNNCNIQGVHSRGHQSQGHATTCASCSCTVITAMHTGRSHPYPFLSVQLPHPHAHCNPCCNHCNSCYRAFTVVGIKPKDLPCNCLTYSRMHTANSAVTLM